MQRASARVQRACRRVYIFNGEYHVINWRFQSLCIVYLCYHQGLVGSCVCCCCSILNIIYFYTCTYERVSLRLLQGLRSAVVDNIRRRIVGVMFPPSIFEDRCVDFRRSMIDVSTFEDRCIALQRSMSRCVDLRRSMCRPSEMDVLTFEDR